jgi:DMSO reductase iron-sulfur subunit
MSIKKPKWGMLIDVSKCVGCHACRIACQNQNGLKVREYYNRIEEQESGEFPNYSRRFIPIQCQHCDNPPCVKVCPAGACYKRENGVVFVDREKCIGCKYCILACPYNAPIIQEDEEYMHKCTFCIEFVEKDGTPACVATCMTGVRVFGDLNDPESEISRIVVKKKIVRLMEDLDTKPSIYYILS